MSSQTKPSINYQEAKKRILAAQALIDESTTSREKFSSVCKLVKGIHPKLDAALDRCEEELTRLEQIQSGDVIGLSADALPEDTEEQKKRKKAILFFISSWTQLKSEMIRVQKEMEAASRETDLTAKSSHWGRIFNFAKGPFGIVTIAVVAVGVALQATSVQVIIENRGCGDLEMSRTISFPLPGLSLPQGTIPDGDSAVATLPPISFTADATEPGAITLSGLRMRFTYYFPVDVDDIELNGSSVLGTVTEVNLSDREEHTLALVCR